MQDEQETQHEEAKQCLLISHNVLICCIIWPWAQSLIRPEVVCEAPSTGRTIGHQLQSHRSKSIPVLIFISDRIFLPFHRDTFANCSRVQDLTLHSNQLRRIPTQTALAPLKGTRAREQMTIGIGQTQRKRRCFFN